MGIALRVPIHTRTETACARHVPPRRCERGNGVGTRQPAACQPRLIIPTEAGYQTSAVQYMSMLYSTDIVVPRTRAGPSADARR